ANFEARANERADRCRHQRHAALARKGLFDGGNNHGFACNWRPCAAVVSGPDKRHDAGPVGTIVPKRRVTRKARWRAGGAVPSYLTRKSAGRRYLSGRDLSRWPALNTFGPGGKLAVSFLPPQGFRRVAAAS